MSLFSKLMFFVFFLRVWQQLRQRHLREEGEGPEAAAAAVGTLQEGHAPPQARQGSRTPQHLSQSQRHQLLAAQPAGHQEPLHRHQLQCLVLPQPRRLLLLQPGHALRWVWALVQQTLVLDQVSEHRNIIMKSGFIEGKFNFRHRPLATISYSVSCGGHLEWVCTSDLAFLGKTDKKVST